jgi:AraC-like DNA-binding protein
MPRCRLAALGLATDGALRMAPLLGLPRLLSEHGLDPNAVIRGQGCDPALFDEPNNTIAFSAVGQLLAHAAAATGCAYPGLELGRHSGIEVLGAVGRAARLAPDVGSALRCLILNMHLHDRGAVPYLWISGEQALFGYTLYCPDVVGTDHIYDGAIAIAQNLIQELAGPEWRPTEVRLFRDPPADIGPFRDHFRARLRFMADQAGVVFPSADLQRRLPSADPVRYAAALRDLESLDVFSGYRLADKVLRVLRHSMVSGAGLGEAAFDRATVAGLFALHPRTLNRRLRAEGTRFSALLAAARYDIARELLRDTRLPIDAVARMLGYSDTVSFIHAFRRWSGTTATAWRTDHRSRAAPGSAAAPPAG